MDCASPCPTAHLPLIQLSGNGRIFDINELPNNRNIPNFYIGVMKILNNLDRRNSTKISYSFQSPNSFRQKAVEMDSEKDDESCRGESSLTTKRRKLGYPSFAINERQPSHVKQSAVYEAEPYIDEAWKQFHCPKIQLEPNIGTANTSGTKSTHNWDARHLHHCSVSSSATTRTSRKPHVTRMLANRKWEYLRKIMATKTQVGRWTELI